MMRQNIFDIPDFFLKYQELRSSPICHNELIEKPSIYSLLPSLSGKKVLDIGCGFGDFAFHAAKNHSSEVVGVDLSQKMLQIPRKENCFPNVSFINDDIMNIEFDEQTFDLIYSSLTLHYIDDIDLLMKKVFRWLKMESKFIFSIEHPINTACPNAWIYNASGKRSGWGLKDYDTEGKRIFDWFVTGIEKYHRKLDTYVRTIKVAGFNIDEINEPIISDNILCKNPDLEYEKIRPPYLIFSLSKQ
jgi:ubiquinone/menaquinone biosynthesis C-methylase UbiE